MGAFQNHLHALYGLPGGFYGATQAGVAGGSTGQAVTLFNKVVYSSQVERAKELARKITADTQYVHTPELVGMAGKIQQVQAKIDKSIEQVDALNVAALTIVTTENRESNITEHLEKAELKADITELIEAQREIATQILEMYDEEMLLLMIMH